jgi:hypothetical protein
MQIRVHIVHMWWQGDGPMLEEIAGRTNFKNRAWWWQHPLVGIDVRLLGLANFHTVYPYSLNEKGMSTRNTPDMIDKQAQNVADLRVPLAVRLCGWAFRVSQGARTGVLPI